MSKRTPQRLGIDNQHHQLVLTRRRVNLGMTLFLGLWLAMWGGGTVLMWMKGINEGDTTLSYAAVGFSLAWLISGFFFLDGIIGVERLTLDREGAHYVWQVGAAIQRRSIALQKIRSCKEVRSHWQSDSGPTRWSIEVCCIGCKSIRFAAGASKAERRQIVEAFEQKRAELDPELSSGSVAKRSPQRDTDLAERDELDAGSKAAPSGGGAAGSNESIVTLGLSQAQLDPPSKASFEYLHEADSVAVHYPGARQFSVVLWIFVTVFAGFWNGIIGVMAFSAMSEGSWWIAAFLVPFVVVGLLLLAFWILVTILPWTVWGHRLGAGEYTYYVRGFGMRIRRRKPFKRLAPLELRKSFSRERRGGSDRGPTEEVERYHLFIRTAEGVQLAKLGCDSAYEARWLAQQVYRDLGGWFVDVPERDVRD